MEACLAKQERDGHTILHNTHNGGRKRAGQPYTIVRIAGGEQGREESHTCPSHSRGARRETVAQRGLKSVLFCVTITWGKE